LPITTCRRALAGVPGAEDAGAGLLALPGAPAPEPPRVRMLGAFDTSLLGWRDRDLLVPPAEAHRLLPGGGVVRAVVLASGRAAGTWKVEGSGARRRVTFNWFADPPPADALASEIAAVGEWLGLELEPAS
jgi:hypothetical protein